MTGERPRLRIVRLPDESIRTVLVRLEYQDLKHRATGVEMDAADVQDQLRWHLQIESDPVQTVYEVDLSAVDFRRATILEGPD